MPTSGFPARWGFPEHSAADKLPVSEDDKRIESVWLFRIGEDKVKIKSRPAVIVLQVNSAFVSFLLLNPSRVRLLREDKPHSVSV